MRVLEVLDCYYPKFDGPTIVITNYCKCLNKIDDVEAEVCVPRFPHYTDDQPFKVNRVKSLKGPEGYYYGLPSFDRKLKRYLKENKFDIIHIHSPFTMCSFFTKYAKKHHIPTIFTFHTKFREDFDRVLRLKTSRKIAMSYILRNIRRADHVLAVSDGAADTLREYGYKGEIGVIRNGSDLIYPNNAEALRDKVKKLHNLSAQDKIFLSVGRLVETKRLDFALDVMSKLKSKGLQFKYFIVGEGPYEQNLRNKVEKLNLQDNVIFTGRVLDREMLAAYYLSADLFVFPSTFDTSGLVVIEAAAMGLPTILTRGCTSAEIIDDNINGILADNDIDDWCDRIMDVVSNNKLSTIAQKAKSDVGKSWQEISEEIYEYYKKILDK